MSLSEEIYKYTDYDRFVSPRRCSRLEKNASGNGILYLSLKHVLLSIRDERTSDTDKEFESVIRSCQPSPFITGVYTRGPNHPNKNTTFDDYTALLVASKYLSNNFAYEILEYGRQSFGIYNTHLEKLEKPSKQFLWRNPSFIALSRQCTGLDSGAFKWFAIGAVWWNIFRLATHLARYDRGQDCELFSWLVIRGFDLQEKLTGKVFESLIEHRFGNVNEIMKRVLVDKDHTLIKYFVF